MDDKYLSLLKSYMWIWASQQFRLSLRIKLSYLISRTLLGSVTPLLYTLRALHRPLEYTVCRHSAVVKYNTMSTWCFIYAVFKESWGPDKHDTAKQVHGPGLEWRRFCELVGSWGHLYCVSPQLATARAWTCLNFPVNVALKWSRQFSKVILLTESFNFG